MHRVVKPAIALLAVLLAGLASPVASLGEPSVINLSCDGEVTNGADQKEPVKKVGLIVNFTQHTVSGFPVIAHIKDVSDAMVEFGGSKTDALGTSSIMGTIDRVTGATQLTTIVSGRDGKIIETRSWDLVCKLTNRLF
jgi:hypothetical protein